MINQIKFTNDPFHRYILPYQWFHLLLNYKDKNSELPSSKIENKIFLKDNKLKDDIDLRQMVFVIYEVMFHVNNMYKVDYIIRVEYKVQESEIQISTAVVMNNKAFVDNKSNNAENKVLHTYILGGNARSDIGVYNNNNISLSSSRNKGNELSINNNNNNNNYHGKAKSTIHDAHYTNVNEDSSNNVNLSHSNHKHKATRTKANNNTQQQQQQRQCTPSTNDKTTKTPSSIEDIDKSQLGSSSIQDIYNNNNNTISMLTNLNQYPNYTLPPVGLINPSIYCFMNTCLQCLCSIPELNYYFINSKYKEEKKNKRKGLNACNSYRDFLMQYNTETNPFRPTSSMYNTCHSFLEAHTQHDCQEFLRRFLGAMQDELNYKKKYTFPDNITMDKAWNIYRKVNPSFVDSVFTGLMRSCVKCMKCNYCSYTFDPFMDLSVSIKYKKGDSLEKSLGRYFAKETIGADCGYRCESCKKKTSVKYYIKHIYIMYI